MRKMEKRIGRLAKLFLILMLVSTTMFSSHSGLISYEAPSVNASRSVTVVAGSSNGNVFVYNEAGILMWSYYTGADVASVAASSDGSYVAIGSLENKLYLFTRGGNEIWEKTVPISSGYGGGWMGTESKSVAISADGEYIVAGCTDSLYVYKMDGTLQWSHAGQETCVDISPNGENIVSCNNNDGTIHFFSTWSSTPLWTESMDAFWVATSDTGYAAASSYSTVYLFDKTGTQVWSYHHPKWDGDLIRVDMPENGLSVVAINDDPADYPGCVLCYWNDLKDGTPGWSSGDNSPVWVFEPGGGPGDTDFYGVAISGNGDYITTGPSYGSYVFSHTSNVPLQTFDMGTGNSYGLTFDGQYGACGSRQGGLYYFSRNSGTPLWSKTIGGIVHAVALACFAKEEWPMFHHDLTRAGYSISVAPHTNNIIWSYTTGSRVRSSPAVADDMVYVGSYDDKVYCLNATTGEHIWDYTTGGPVESSPAVADDMVCVGSYDDKVYCLNATTGAFVWSYTTGGLVESSPAVADDMVYVGSLDYSMYCLNATTGEQVWNYTTGNWIGSSPAIADDRVYVGSGDDRVYCLNATTGDQIWNYTTGLWVESCPAIVEGIVFIGSGDKKVYALNATTGEHIWNFTTGGWDSSPAVADGRVYVGSGDDKVYCLNATTGEQIWTYATDLCVGSSPAVADDMVYVGSYDDRVYCLNATTGAFVWSYTTGARVCSSPAVANGKVYVGSEDYKVYAFEDPIFSLTITTSFGGATVPGPGTYKFYEGTTVMVTAIPQSGYGFDHWELDSSWDYSNPTDITMNSNHALQAIFNYTAVINAHCYTENADVSINIAMDGSSTGYTTPCSFNLTEAHNFTVPDTDTNGHVFTQWNTGETSTTVTVASSGTYIAYYQARYNLTITTTEGGTTDPPPGNYSYWDETTASVTATPTLGYLLDHWELDSADAGTSNPISIIMNMSHILNAVFSWVGICNLTITPTTGGTTSPTSGVYSYTNGTSAEITAIPDAGYGLDHWELDGFSIGSQNPTIVMMDSNHTLNAVFKLTFELTISTTTGGTTDPSPGTHTYTEGTTVTATATAYTGNAFDHWELDGSWNYSNPINVTMDANHTLHAVFTYSVTIVAHCNTEGVDVSVSISIDGSPTGYTTPQTFNLTGTHTLTVASSDPSGHPFYRWSTGNTSTTISVSSGGTYTAYYYTPTQPPVTSGGGGDNARPRCCY